MFWQLEASLPEAKIRTGKNSDRKQNFKALPETREK